MSPLADRTPARTPTEETSLLRGGGARSSPAALWEEEAAVEAKKEFLSRAFTYACLAVFAVVLFLLASSSSASSSAASSSTSAYAHYRAWYGAGKQARGASVPASSDVAAAVSAAVARPDAGRNVQTSSAELHEHTLPTPLWVRHHETGMFLNSLNNSLFEEMKVARFSHSPAASSSSSAADAAGEGRPSLKVDRSSVRFGESLTLSWSGRDRDAAETDPNDDVIGLYCPSTELNPRKFRDAATFRQVLAMTDSALGDSSRGEWSVHRFPYIREQSCEFRLWRRLSSSSSQEGSEAEEAGRVSERRRRRTLQAIEPEPGSSTDNAAVTSQFDLVASSGPILLADALTTPTALHLSLTNDPSEMVVHFTTGMEGTPLVEYFSKDDSMDLAERLIERGTSSTYGAEDMCHSPANLTEPGKFISPGQLHVVRLSGLELDAEYSYRVGVVPANGKDESILWSEQHTFRTALAPGSLAAFTYIVYGDQGCPDDGWGYGAERTARFVEREVEEAPDGGARMVHHFGDLSYAQGAGHIWDDWFDMISSFAPRVPLMVGVGNHEYGYTSGGDGGRDPSHSEDGSGAGYLPSWGNFGPDSGGECGVSMARRFVMPNNGNGVFWYSFDYVTVHTVVISSEHDLSPGSDQYAWLRRDLTSVDRAVTPWLVVESHRPMYHAEDKPENTLVGQHMREEFEDLLRENRVDLFLAGHYHSYHRSCDGLYRSECGKGGPTHVTVGSAGAKLDEDELFENGWTEFYSSEFGYGRITVTDGGTALHFEFVADEDGEVRDEVWLNKSDR